MNKIKHYFSIIVVIIVIIPFTFWGVYGYFDQVNISDNEVGSVAGKKLLLEDLRKIQNRLLNNIVNQNEGELPAEYQDTRYVEALAAKLLIEEELYQFAVRDFKMSMSDKYFAQLIMALPIFQTDGSFDKSKLNTFLIERDITALNFESEYRKILSRDTINISITGSAIANQWERKYLAHLFSQRRTIDLFYLSSAQYALSLKIPEERIKKYFEENKDQFMTQEALDVKYIIYNKDSLVDSYTPTQKEITELYQNNYIDSSRSERRKAFHILLSDANVTDESKKKMLNEIRSSIDSLDRFKEIAKTTSNDIGTAAQGGELGWIEKNDELFELDSNFENALFSLSLDDPISKPIKTQYGFHLIYLAEVSRGDTVSIEEVRGSIIEQLKERYINDTFNNKVAEIENYILENPSEIEGLSKILESNVIAVKDLTRESGSGDFTEESLRSSAFEHVLANQTIIAPIEYLSNQEVMIYQPVKYTPSKLQSYDLSRGRAEYLASLEVAKQEIKQEKTELIAQLKRGETPIQNDYLGIRRDQLVFRLDFESNLPEDLVHQIYSVGTFYPSDESVHEYELDNGDYLVYYLKNIVPVNDESVEEIVELKEHQEYFEKLRTQNNQQAILNAYVARALLEFDRNYPNQDIATLTNYLKNQVSITLDSRYAEE